MSAKNSSKITLALSSPDKSPYSVVSKKKTKNQRQGDLNNKG